MKRAMILTGVFALVVSMGLQVVEAGSLTINDRTSKLQANLAENHGVKMTAGRQFVSVAARNETPVATVLFRVTKDIAGKLVFNQIKPTRKVWKNGAMAYEFRIPATGAYVITVVSKQSVASYCVATTGTFVGKPFTVKLRK